MMAKMKLPVLVSAIALTLSFVSAFPVVAQSVVAQSNGPVAPGQNGAERNRSPRRGEWLNLTPEQQAEMREIRQRERSQIEAILTDEQRAQLQSARENRQSARRGNRQGSRPEAGQGRSRAPFAQLNLTEEQRSRIEAIRRSSRAAMEALLTDEQRQQLEQHRQQHQQRQQMRRSAPVQ